MASFAAAASAGPGIQYRPDNTIIFTIARMNPPTPGHLEVISNLIMEAISKGIPRVFVILSKTNDNNEDPIPCPEKIQALGQPDRRDQTMINSLKSQMMSKEPDPTIQAKIQAMRVELICVPDQKGATPFSVIMQIVGSPEFRRIPDVNLFLTIGADRINMVDSITQIMEKSFPNVNSVNYKALPREGMEEFKALSKDPTRLCGLDMTKMPISALSASFVRNVTKSCPIEKFIELYTPYLDPTIIQQLYESTHRGLDLPTKTKKDDPVKPLKYAYPWVKGSKGGKRRKRKTIRKRRTNKKRKTMRMR
jgi:hypothetical protein